MATKVIMALARRTFIMTASALPWEERADGHEKRTRIMMIDVAGGRPRAPREDDAAAEGPILDSNNTFAPVMAGLGPAILRSCTREGRVHDGGSPG
jgi:hypothetical protein